MPIAYVIREMRLSKALTLSELARRASISKGHLSQIEARNFLPGLVTLEKIANGLGADSASLLGLTVSEILLQDPFVRHVRWFLPRLTLEQRKRLLQMMRAAPKVGE